VKFAPKPGNDFRAFYTRYFERCAERFGKIEALAAKWTFEDLIPGLSDFDTRLICNNAMTADDWIEMSLAVGAVHSEMTRQFPQWARILEHLPGLNLTWRELVDPVTYYPESNQWTFYLGDEDKLEASRRKLRALEWTARDEYFHIKKFSIYYGPYQRGIDPPINLGPYENKYPLHSRIWHFLVTPLQSALSILERRNIAGKMETLRLARERLENAELVERVMEILDAHYEAPDICDDPGLGRFERELEAYLRMTYRPVVPQLTLFRGADDDTPDDLRARLARVHVDPVQQFFEVIKFSRLMKGRLLFYAEEIPHFDSIPCIRIDLGRMRANFFEKPLSIYGTMRYQEDLAPEEVASRLRGDLWSAAEYDGVMKLARLAPLPESAADYRPLARRIAEDFEPFLRAIEKLSAHVRRDLAASDTQWRD